MKTKVKVFNQEEQLFFAGMLPTNLSNKKVDEHYHSLYFGKPTEAQLKEVAEYRIRVTLFYRMVRVWAGFSGYLSKGYNNYGKKISR